MKSNYTHICFVIDQSGSMFSSASDVEGGVRKIIEEQKAVTEGTCSISLFTFDTTVHEEYVFEDVHHIPEYKFVSGGLTAMNDGIGMAIDAIGKILAKMPEEERPEKNTVVIITDGYENNSKEYTFEKVKEMIKHQEEKYSWTFTYIGVDLSSSQQANNIGIKNQGYVTREKLGKIFTKLSRANTSYRAYNGDAASKNAVFGYELSATMADVNKEYLQDTGIDITNN